MQPTKRPRSEDAWTVGSESPETLKAIADSVDRHDEQLWKIGQLIHSNPELGYAEFKAHDNITALLESLGYAVKRHAYGLETSFMAEFGSGGRVVAFNAEYDALPEMGHACGHNLIAMMSIGAFVALAEALKARPGVPGCVRLVGTPAEEGGGGKARLVAAGAYADVDACLMAHPGPAASCGPGWDGHSYMPTLANHKFTVHYTGKPAHAAVSPWQGVNALDAVVLAYTGISALRQQIRPEQRIHGVITKGGTRPNVITADAALDYYIRSPTLEGADELLGRAKKCFEGAAVQTGCTVDFEIRNTCADVRPNKPICTLYADAMTKIGSKVGCDLNASPVSGSTDQGNVSYECPAFHAIVGIPAAPGSFNHTPGFTAFAAAREAHDKCIPVAKGMAIAGWNILADDAIAARVKEDFEEDKKSRGSLPSAVDLPHGAGCCHE